MSKNIYLAQTEEELNFIINKLNEEAICVPLNLSTHLYCINNNINYCNPINLIEKKFHHKALLESDRLIKNIDSGNIKYDSVLKEFTSAIRHRFYSAYFLVELINKIDLNEKINKIYISGWNGNFNYNSDTDYFISYLVKTLFKKFKIYEFSNQTNKKNNKTNVKYLLRPKKKFNGKTFFLNNLGYKFTRILFFCFKNGYTVITLDQKLSFIKRFIFLISGVKFVSFVKSEEKRESQIYIPDVNFKSDDIDFSEILTKKKIKNCHI